MATAVLGFSTPVFVIGYVLAYIFALRLDWLPVQGFISISQGLWPFVRNLILPAVALGLIYMALIARITRATMLDVLSQDYVRTAKAKGVGQRDMLFVHALKNAAVPIVTVIGIGFAALIGGAVVTESVFAIPGLGRLTVDAILRRDYPVIKAWCCCSASSMCWSTWGLIFFTRCSTRGSAIERNNIRPRRRPRTSGHPAHAEGPWADRRLHLPSSDDLRRRTAGRA